MSTVVLMAAIPMAIVLVVDPLVDYLGAVWPESGAGGFAAALAMQVAGPL